MQGKTANTAVLQIHRRVGPRCRPLLPPCTAAGTKTKPGYVFVGWLRYATLRERRRGLTASRVLALSGQARHVHQVSRSLQTREVGAGADRGSIGDSDDDLGRMLACLRFWFTKDLVCGPPLLACFACSANTHACGRNTSRASLASLTTRPSASSFAYVPWPPLHEHAPDPRQCNWKIEDSHPTFKTATSAPSSSANSVAGDAKLVTVSYLTEQTSHHPPVSAFYVDCPEKGISARGYDQLSAKFTGTSVRVVPGAHNLGIFVTLKNRDNEEYQLTHPAAYLGGLLRGASP
jgi:hypothetical protein